MGTAQTSPSGPDLTQGVPVDRLSDGRMLAGHVGEEVVLLVQRGNDFFAVGATCTITAVRLRTGWWSETPCGVPGITPVSA